MATCLCTTEPQFFISVTSVLSHIQDVNLTCHTGMDPWDVHCREIHLLHELIKEVDHEVQLADSSKQDQILYGGPIPQKRQPIVRRNVLRARRNNNNSMNHHVPRRLNRQHGSNMFYKVSDTRSRNNHVLSSVKPRKAIRKSPR